MADELCWFVILFITIPSVVILYIGANEINKKNEDPKYRDFVIGGVFGIIGPCILFYIVECIQARRRKSKRKLHSGPRGDSSNIHTTTDQFIDYESVLDYPSPDD